MSFRTNSTINLVASVSQTIQKCVNGRRQLLLRLSLVAAPIRWHAVVYVVPGRLNVTVCTCSYIANPTGDEETRELFGKLAGNSWVRTPFQIPKPDDADKSAFILCEPRMARGVTCRLRVVVPLYCRKYVEKEFPKSAADIITLSTELGLNERACSRYFLDASKMLVEDGGRAKDGAEPQGITVARQLFYAERRDILMAILRLVRLREELEDGHEKFIMQTNKCMLVRAWALVDGVEACITLYRAAAAAAIPAD